MRIFRSPDFPPPHLGTCVPLRHSCRSVFKNLPLPLRRSLALSTPPPTLPPPTSPPPPPPTRCKISFFLHFSKNRGVLPERLFGVGCEVWISLPFWLRRPGLRCRFPFLFLAVSPASSFRVRRVVSVKEDLS